MFFKAFMLSSLASFSTVLGAIVFLNIKKKNNIIIDMLAFSAGVMFAISIIDLIPTSYNYINCYTDNKTAIIFLLSFIIIGLIIAKLSDKVFNKNDNDLYRVGLVSMLAIIIHNIPEGIVTFLTATNNFKLGLRLSLGITMHNIPEGISIALPIYYGSNNKRKAYLYTVLSALSEVLGTIFASLFLYKVINDFQIGIIFAITSGIMIYIALFDLFKVSLSYNNKRKTYISFIIGILFTIITILLIQ